MRTVQMTLDEDLVADIDQAAKELATSRSALARDALRAFLAQLQAKKLAEKHRQGYKKHPTTQEIFTEWQEEQVWGGDNEAW